MYSRGNGSLYGERDRAVPYVRLVCGNIGFPNDKMPSDTIKASDGIFQADSGISCGFSNARAALERCTRPDGRGFSRLRSSLRRRRWWCIAARVAAMRFGG